MAHKSPLELADELVKWDDKLMWWIDLDDAHQQLAGITQELRDHLFEASWFVNLAVNTIRSAYKELVYDMAAAIRDTPTWSQQELHL